MDIRTDFETLEDGDLVIIHPLQNNPIHKGPVECTYAGGYFHCRDSNPMDGPDYYLGDVLAYNRGFTLPESKN